MKNGNYIGIDYHAESLQVCVLSKEGKRLLDRKISNNVTQLIKVVKPLGKVCCVTLESCNGAAAFADEVHDKTLWPVKLAHPGYVRRMKQNPDKTDFGDARLLGDLSRVGYLPEVWLAPPFVRQLRTMTRFRQQRVLAAKKEKLRIRALLRNERISIPKDLSLWSKAGLQWLENNTSLADAYVWVVRRHVRNLHCFQQEVRETEVELRKMTSNDTLIRLLLEQRGIGLITACTLRAEVGIFSRFGTGKQLSRFCGLSPRNASSGEKQADAGLIKAANPLLKTAIIEGAHSLIRWDDTHRAFASRLYKQGKPGSVVIAAVANRWIRRLFYTLRETEEKEMKLKVA